MGPGTYDPKTDFVRMQPVQFQCFGSTQERIPPQQSENQPDLGPGSYNPI
jgi:hypothetical protein